MSTRKPRTPALRALATGAALLLAQMALAQDDHGDGPRTSTLLRLGEPVPGQVVAGDVDVFRFDLVGPTSVQVRTSGQADTAGRLSSSAGTLLATDDNSGARENFLIRQDLGRGIYYIQVRGSGSYAVDVTVVGDAEDLHGDTLESATVLRLWSPEEVARVTPLVLLATSGRIFPAADVDVFRIDVREDGTEVLTRATGAANANGSLLDSEGRTIRSDASGGNFGFSSRLAAGIYYLQVTAPAAGAYRVLAQGSPPSSTGPGAFVDTDGDGVGDASDAFPLDRTETRDYDGDGVGDNADLDDDNDTASDVIDDYPNDARRSVLAGVFRPSADFAGFCANPRTGVDGAGAPYADRPGSVAYENNWLRSWSNEDYLWYDEIVDVDPIHHDTPTYFNLMRTFATTPSGKDKDSAHFSLNTEEYLAARDAGVAVGYGARWALLRSRPPRDVRIAYTEPNSPATRASLTRGAQVIEVDGVSVRDGAPSALNAGLFPSEPGESHTFLVRDLAGSERTIVLAAEEITEDPVQNEANLERAERTVGYMLFNDHSRVAEGELAAAVRRFASAGVDELVLDLRYNGGGLLYVAAELGYMVAGAKSIGRVFDGLQYNDKSSHKNFDFPFLQIDSEDQALPTLDLDRLFVLAGPGTCSASEALVNALRGIDVEVVLIGAATCGKPYGFLPEDNCGTTYFSIQFKGVNDKGFGDYADGFVPVRGGGTEPWHVPGCLVADDFDHLLGDPDEARLQAALGYMQTGTCPAASSSAVSLTALDDALPMKARDLLRENRFYDGYRDAVVRQDRHRTRVLRQGR